MNINQLIVVVFVVIFSTIFSMVQMSHEKRLIRDLIGNYTERGKMGRPVEHHNDIINISFGLSLIQILDLDERNQVLSTNVWVTYHWTDIYLAWNKSAYGGIEEVRVRNEDIWKPDIKLYNYADERLEEKRNALSVLSSDGSVQWVPQAIFKSSCSIDIEQFPFDTQSCKMKFGSWTYDGTKLDLITLWDKFEMVDYVVSNEWDIVWSNVSKNTKYYPCCPNAPYVDITFYLKIRRKVAFYNYILILPCVLLSSLTLVLFWLPPESPAKMQLGMNIFVAFFVLLLLLAESTPPAASSIPLIGAYYCLNMILITLSTLLSVVVVNLYFHGPGTRVPVLFKRVMLDFFAHVFCMRNTLMDKKEQADRRHVSTRKSLVETTIPPAANNAQPGFTNANTQHKTGSTRDVRRVDFKYDRVGVYEMTPEDNWRPTTNGLGSDMDVSERVTVGLHPAYNQLEGEVREIRRHLRQIVEKSAEKAHKEYLAREWKLVALVLDRLFFFIYLVALITSAFVLFDTTVFKTGIMTPNNADEDQENIT